jgi:hypothetical protein
MSTFIFFGESLADTPESELRKTVTILWKTRFDIVDIGDHRSVGASWGYQISLHRLSQTEFVFLVAGVSVGDDRVTLSRIFDEVMNG